jgi:predicted RNA-binding protein with PIN domain
LARALDVELSVLVTYPARMREVDDPGREWCASPEMAADLETMVARIARHTREAPLSQSYSQAQPA